MRTRAHHRREGQGPKEYQSEIAEEQNASHVASNGFAASGVNGVHGEVKPIPSLEAMVKESPFIAPDPIGWYEAFKMAIMFPVVMIKMGAFFSLIFWTWAAMRLFLLGNKGQSPLSPIRKFLVQAWIKGAGRLAMALAGFYTLPCKGWENARLAQEARSIVVFNHETYIDAALISALFVPSGVAKSGVASLPLLGTIGRAMQCIFVERKGTSDKANGFVVAKDPLEAIREIAADPRYPLVALAPEATTKAKPCLLKFRRGAFAASRPVTPVLVTYPYKHFNPGWGICNTPVHFYRLFAQFVNHVSIEVLPPVFPTAQEQLDPNLFAANVRRLMGTKLGVPLVDQGMNWAELMAKGVHLDLLGREIIVPSQTKEE